MKNYIPNIEEETRANTFFRKVIYTDSRLQLVLMSLEPNENIPKEIHNLDQFIRIEAGEGEAILNGVPVPLKDGSAIIIPKGIQHEIRNTSATMALKLYTIYTPPEHADGTIHKTRAEALEAEARHHH